MGQQRLDHWPDHQGKSDVVEFCIKVMVYLTSRKHRGNENNGHNTVQGDPDTLDGTPSVSHAKFEPDWTCTSL